MLPWHELCHLCLVQATLINLYPLAGPPWLISCEGRFPAVIKRRRYICNFIIVANLIAQAIGRQIHLLMKLLEWVVMTAVMKTSQQNLIVHMEMNMSTMLTT